MHEKVNIISIFLCIVIKGDKHDWIPMKLKKLLNEMLHNSTVCSSAVEARTYSPHRNYSSHRIYSSQRKIPFLDNTLIIHIKVHKDFFKNLGSSTS